VGKLRFGKRLFFLSDRGQTMAETAVVLPVLLLLILGILQLGIAFNNYMTLTDAVREGARTAAVSRHYSDRVSRTVNKVKASSANLDLSKLKISVSSTWEPASDVTVRAEYPYELKLVGLIVHSGTVSTHTVERVE
jgi:Flp pilus assembly protein TadG